MKTENTLNLDDVTLRGRQLFIFEPITSKTSSKIIKSLLVLDNMNHDAITIWINSPGGECTAGLAIIDVMKKVKSPIVTIVVGEACSMACLISISGNKRYAYNNSFWMSHPLSAWSADYLNYMKDRMVYLDKLNKIIIDIQTNNTKLSKKELEKCKNGELWIMGDKLVEKGIVDKIIK